MTNQEEEVAHDKSAPDELKQGKIPDDGSCITQSDQVKDMDKSEGRDAICRQDDQMANLEEVAHDKSAPDELKQGKIPDDGSCMTQSDQGKDMDKSEGRDAICRLDDQMANLEEVAHDKSAPDELKQGKIPDDGSCTTQSDQRKDTDKSEGRDADKSAPLELKHEKIPDDGVCIPHSDRGNDEDEGTPNELKLEKIHDDGCSISHTDREKDVAKLPVADAKLEIVLYDGPTDILELTPRAENTPVHAEKAPEDGFNWRKYGQKNVRANEFVRSYYRCTYPFCQVKRQVERSHDGQITDTVYLGHHSHPPINSPAAVNPPVSPTSKKSDKSRVTNVKEKASELKIPAYPPVSNVPRSEAARLPHKDEEKRVVLQMDKIPDDVTFNGSPLVLKKKKRGPDNANPLGGDTPSSEARTVVHTVSEVDIVHDGHRWRKYGQKMVKGNTNPRSYYRCSLVGCPARKLVERASHDHKVVITTYEGQHLHRTDGSAAISPSHTEDTKKQSHNTESARAIIVAEASTTGGKVDEECHRKGKKRAYISHLVGFDMFVLPGPESKSDEKPIRSSSGNLGDSDKAGHGPFSDAKDEHTHAQPHTNNAAAVRS